MSDFDKPDRWALIALVVFTALALAGFGSFGRNPELLARFPDLAGLYAPAFTFFARGHIVIAFVALAVILSRRAGGRWVPALLVVAAISLGAELLGTTTGFPFGEYSYTELLGYQVADKVPFLIPISWFVMALPSYAIARSLSSSRGAQWLLGAALLTIWDLTLDPAMSDLTPYWTWAVEGSFYGMPLVNLLGWMGTGVVIMLGLDLVRAGQIADAVPVRLHWTYYGVVLALSVGMVAFGGYWGAVVATAAALAAVVGAARFTPRSTSNPTHQLAHEGTAG